MYKYKPYTIAYRCLFGQGNLNRQSGRPEECLRVYLAVSISRRAAHHHTVSRRLPDGAVLCVPWPAFKRKRICSGEVGCLLPSGLSSIQPDSLPTGFLDGRRVPPANPGGKRWGRGLRRGGGERVPPPPSADPTARPAWKRLIAPIGHFYPSRRLRTEPCHCSFAFERLIGLLFSAPYFFHTSSAATEAEQSPTAASRGGRGRPVEGCEGAFVPRRGPRSCRRCRPGPCPARVRTAPPGGPRGSGGGGCCFRQMRRRSAGAGDARINKRAVFDLFSLSPSWNRFSHSHISPEGIFLGLVQRKMVLKTNLPYPSSRLLLMDRVRRAPRVSPAKLTPSLFPREKCTVHPPCPGGAKKTPKPGGTIPSTAHTLQPSPPRAQPRCEKSPAEGRKTCQ